jgi:hypothetical protein
VGHRNRILCLCGGRFSFQQGTAKELQYAKRKVSTTMTSIPIIRSELMKVRVQLLKAPVFIKGAGQSASSPSGPRNTADLEKLLTKVKLLLRDLAAQGNLARLHKYSVPPHSEQRWVSQQREKESDQAFKEALALRDLLTDLLARNGLLSGMDTANGLISFAKEVDGEVARILGSQQHVQVPDRPAYIPAILGAHPVGAESLVALVAWIVLAMHKLKKKSESS